MKQEELLIQIIIEIYYNLILQFYIFEAFFFVDNDWQLWRLKEDKSIHLCSRNCFADN